MVTVTSFDVQIVPDLAIRNPLQARELPLLNMTLHHVP